jgi:hypothetical protein
MKCLRSCGIQPVPSRFPRYRSSRRRFGQEFSVQIQTIDEGYEGLAIRDHPQVAMDFGIAQRLAHQADISRVVFGEINLAG